MDLPQEKARVPPNGERYPRVGGTRQHHFDGTNSKPRKLPKNAATPTRRVHAVLGSSLNARLFSCEKPTYSFTKYPKISAEAEINKPITANVLSIFLFFTWMSNHTKG